ncbi:MAG: hypothetical protein RR989_03555 [Ruthenibacterium sp.]
MTVSSAGTSVDVEAEAGADAAGVDAEDGAGGATGVSADAEADAVLDAEDGAGADDAAARVQRPVPPVFRPSAQRRWTRLPSTRLRLLAWPVQSASINK